MMMVPTTSRISPVRIQTRLLLSYLALAAAIVSSLAVVLVFSGTIEAQSAGENISALRQRAEQGDAEAQARLGLMYDEGWRVL